MRKAGRKTFLRNDNDIQAIESVRCGYYFCCFSVNERNKGVSFSDILLYERPAQNPECAGNRPSCHDKEHQKDAED